MRNACVRYLSGLREFRTDKHHAYTYPRAVEIIITVRGRLQDIFGKTSIRAREQRTSCPATTAAAPHEYVTRIVSNCSSDYNNIYNAVRIGRTALWTRRRTVRYIVKWEFPRLETVKISFDST
jgi:hypothetical protein